MAVEKKQLTVFLSMSQKANLTTKNKMATELHKDVKPTNTHIKKQKENTNA